MVLSNIPRAILGLAEGEWGTPPFVAARPSLFFGSDADRGEDAEPAASVGLIAVVVDMVTSQNEVVPYILFARPAAWGEEAYGVYLAVDDVPPPRDSGLRDDFLAFFRRIWQRIDPARVELEYLADFLASRHDGSPCELVVKNTIGPFLAQFDSAAARKLLARRSPPPGDWCPRRPLVSVRRVPLASQSRHGLAMHLATVPAAVELAAAAVSVARGRSPPPAPVLFDFGAGDGAAFDPELFPLSVACSAFVDDPAPFEHGGASESSAFWNSPPSGISLACKLWQLQLSSPVRGARLEISRVCFPTFPAVREGQFLSALEGLAALSEALDLVVLVPEAVAGWQPRPAGDGRDPVAFFELSTTVVAEDSPLWRGDSARSVDLLPGYALAARALVARVLKTMPSDARPSTSVCWEDLRLGAPARRLLEWGVARLLLAAFARRAGSPRPPWAARALDALAPPWGRAGPGPSPAAARGPAADAVASTASRPRAGASFFSETLRVVEGSAVDTPARRVPLGPKGPSGEGRAAPRGIPSLEDGGLPDPAAAAEAWGASPEHARVFARAAERFRAHTARAAALPLRVWFSGYDYLAAEAPAPAPAPAAAAEAPAPSASAAAEAPAPSATAPAAEARL